MIITRNLNKRNEELIETLHVVKQLSVDLYIKEMEKRLIIQEVTVLGDSRTWLLVWSLVSQIGLVNLLGLN
jgi:hypothetical protein